MNNFNLRKYLKEGKLHEDVMACPLPTQDLELNTKNRNSAIEADYIQYGPLNLNDEESLPDYVKYGVDFMLKYKGFSAIGEYIKSEATVPEDITQRIPKMILSYT